MGIFSGASVAMAASFADLRELSRRRVPRAFFEHADHGSYAGITAARNLSELAALPLRQKVMCDVSTRDISGRFLGRPAALPVALGPVGLAGMHWRDGEIAAAIAARDADIPFCLSTMSIRSIEEIARATAAPFWFQLYMMKDRDFVDSLVARAHAADCSALVLTVDLPVLGARYCDARNGMSVPPRITPGTAFDYLRHWRWCLQMLGGDHRFGNIAGHVPGGDSIVSMGKWVGEQFDASITWTDVARLRDRWSRKLIVKGILTPEDAEEAVDAGADAIVISNHGGRQLDGAPSTIAVLPGIVAAVRGRTEVLVDSGFRSGQDVIRAMSLGANGVLLGRAWVHALGAGGGPGVRRLLGILAAELSTSMALMGVTSLGDLGPGHVCAGPDRPAGP